MPWLLLILAGCLEIAWAAGLKYSHGFTRLWPSVATAIAFVASLYLLALALKSLPLSTAYSVWMGIGAVGTAVIGMSLLGEAASLGRIASIGLIIAGICGLKVTS